MSRSGPGGENSVIVYSHGTSIRSATVARVDGGGEVGCVAGASPSPHPASSHAVPKARSNLRRQSLGVTGRDLCS